MLRVRYRLKVPNCNRMHVENILAMCVNHKDDIRYSLHHWRISVEEHTVHVMVHPIQMYSMHTEIDDILHKYFIIRVDLNQTKRNIYFPSLPYFIFIDVAPVHYLCLANNVPPPCTNY